MPCPTRRDLDKFRPLGSASFLIGSGEFPTRRLPWSFPEMGKGYGGLGVDGGGSGIDFRVATRSIVGIFIGGVWICIERVWTRSGPRSDPKILRALILEHGIIFQLPSTGAFCWWEGACFVFSLGWGWVTLDETRVQEPAKHGICSLHVGRCLQLKMARTCTLFGGRWPGKRNQSKMMVSHTSATAKRVLLLFLPRMCFLSAYLQPPRQKQAPNFQKVSFVSASHAMDKFHQQARSTLRRGMEGVGMRQIEFGASADFRTNISPWVKSLYPQ